MNKVTDARILRVAPGFHGLVRTLQDGPLLKLLDLCVVSAEKRLRLGQNR